MFFSFILFYFQWSIGRRIECVYWHRRKSDRSLRIGRRSFISSLWHCYIKLYIRLPINCPKMWIFHGHLSSIKTTLYDSNVISFSLGIDQEDPTDFYNDSTLIEHIRHIVSICDSSRGYDFHFQSYANSSTFGNLISSILGMPEIARSSFVSISGCYYYYAHTNMQLPVETISNWLNRERHIMDQSQRERRLMLSCRAHCSNIQEMCDFLKQVSFLSSNI